MYHTGGEVKRFFFSICKLMFSSGAESFAKMRKQIINFVFDKKFTTSIDVGRFDRRGLD